MFSRSSSQDVRSRAKTGAARVQSRAYQAKAGALRAQGRARQVTSQASTQVAPLAKSALARNHERVMANGYAALRPHIES